MDFVVLRSPEGERLVNVDHIICFEAGPFNTIVANLSNGKAVAVVEIPQEILDVVKVTPAPVPVEPVAEPAPKIKRPLSES